MERLTFSKGNEWLVIPNLIPEGQEYNVSKFWSHELSAIYLGCRISEHNKSNIIILGKRLNPEVKIYQATVSKREYALHFESL